MDKLTILGISFFPIWDMGNKKGKPSIYFVQKAFVEKGHDVHFLFASEKNLNRMYEGIHIHEFSMPSCDLLPNQLTKGVGFVYRKAISILFALKATKMAIQIAAANRPDIIYGHDFLSAPVAFLISKLYGTANITRLYGTFLYPCFSKPFQLFIRLDEIIGFKIPATYLIITNDGTSGNIVAARLRVPLEKIKFWMNGVDRNMCNPNFNMAEFRKANEIPMNAKIVLLVTRLVAWKRVDRLLRAVPRVVSKNQNVVFFVVGDGPEKESLEHLSEQTGITGYVRFTGALTRDEVSAFLNATDVVVSVNDLTNLVNPVLEAMVCGKCVVALNTGATNEIIKHNSNGIILSENSSKDLGEVLNDLLENPELRTMLGRNARIYSENHFRTWNERAELEVKLVEDVAKRRNRPSSQ